MLQRTYQECLVYRGEGRSEIEEESGWVVVLNVVFNSRLLHIDNVSKN